MAAMLRLVLAFSVLSSLLLTSSAQTCLSYSFSSNQQFATCRDLPHLSSYLHWTYNQTSGRLAVAYRHTGITSTDNWVAWAVNPNNNLDQAMIGAQALVAIPQSSGTPRVYTSSITSTDTTLPEGNLRYDVSNLSATYQNNEVIIFATLSLPSETASMVHVWQEGPVSGSTPQQHSLNSDNIDAKELLDLVSGGIQASGSGNGNSLRRRRTTHGVLNAVSWGIMMPIGAVIARYLKVFKSADQAWFYVHVICQTSAYIVGVAGWGTGLKLGSDSVGITYDTHRALGITLFCLGTLQVFALLLRPNKDYKYRFYWNIYHHTVGYATIIISIINVFRGFDTLEVSVGDRYNNWKNAYIGIIAALGGIAVLLEVYTWILVLKRKKIEGKMSHGVNGANGVSHGVNEANGVNAYDSRPQQV